MREMKDSGVEWIGKIPISWELAQVRYLFKIGRGRVIAQSELKEDGVYPVFSSQTKNNGCLGYIDTYDFDVKQITWTTDGANAGTVFFREGKHSCTNVCGTLQPLYEEIDLKYQKYALEHIANYHKRADTNGFKIMNNEMAAIHTIIPPIEIQHCIADYLDTKCSKIDAIIEREQTVIERLKEYKLSVITEAVTKGLNTAVEMKDSGVEFLGQVPSDWSVMKFGYCATIKSNLVPPEKYYDYPQISPDSIEKGSGKIINYKTVHEAGVISWNHLFYKGQIIYSKIRPMLNKVVIAPYDGLCSADMYPIETDNNYKFLMYMMLSDYFTAQVGLVTENRVKMPKINQNEISAIVVTIPSITEQEEIAKYLERKCIKIDDYISKKQAVIDKITEYKKSLIYEVVTGKLEV